MRSRFTVAVLFLIVMIVSPNAHARANSPAVRMEFQVKQEDLDDLKIILDRYATTERFAVENIGPNMPQKDRRPVFYMSLTRKDSTEITVSNFLKQDQILLFFYGQNISVLDPLISELREKWHDIHPFTGL